VIFLVTYKRNNREPWRFNIAGKGLRQWIERQETYGFDVDIITTEYGMELQIDTHGMGGWEKVI
jgi:hypothetical protein